MAKAFFDTIMALVLLLFTTASTETRKPLAKRQIEISGVEGVFDVRWDMEPGHFVYRWMGLDGNPVEATFEPANKVDVIVEAEVRFDGMTAFEYRYRLRSLARSHQRVFSLIVENAGAVFAIEAPSAWSHGFLSFAPAISWADVRSEPPGIPAGGMASGFGFKAFPWSGSQRFVYERTDEPGVFYYSGSLPGIVRCWVRGYTEVLKVPEEVPEGLAESLPELFDDAVSGPTVGPVAVARNVEPEALLETIRRYNGESWDAGWIAEKASVVRHEELLDRVEQAVEAGEMLSAERLLEKLVEITEEGLANGKLTTEAHALLKYNADYLTWRLRRLSVGQRYGR